MQALWAGGAVGAAAIPEQPDPRFTYLRVQVPGHPPGLLVLGYVDAHPAGPIEVWYSGNTEVLRVQNGRLVGSTGTLRSWAGVRFLPQPPAWADVTRQGARYLRQHDEMPGYRFGISQQIQLEAWQGLPPIELPASLPLAQAQAYQWFRETATPLDGQGGAALPDAWFAWGKRGGEYSVVFSQQCLAAEFCLTLQPWPLWRDPL
jgi:hypothetical protein